ncbi:MAG: DTW domain-containing protein, partial [Natronospirillum sp.]
NAIPVDTAEGKGRSLSVQWPAVWVLPDGTWRKTRRLLLEHSWLNQLPRYSFAHPPPSQYHIRKVPIGGALSTLESVAWLLANVSTLDPEPLYRLQAAMVQQWQGHQPVAHRRHNTVWPF